MSTREERLRAIDAAVLRAHAAEDVAGLLRGGRLFWPVSGVDFARSFAWVRGQSNGVRAQIQHKILALTTGVGESGNVGKNK